VSFFLSVSRTAFRPSNAPPSGSFAELGVPRALADVLARNGITAPRPIQALTLPDALAGRDVLGRAETGSGKTLAFGLPMLTRLAAARAVPRSPTPRGLVLVPTRELARQVRDELAPLAAALSLKLLAVYGGAPIRAQVQALRRRTDVVVATPGRLTDLYRQGACSLDAVTITVIDEADHMADMGFLPQVTWLLDRVPAGGQRLLFSATLDHEVATIVRRYLADPARHTVTQSSATPARMDHQFRAVTATGKVAAAAELATGHRRVLLFVRTKHGATRLTRQLGRAGVRAGALHGNLAQNARQRALAAFSTGTVPVLVATDIAARGIHVDDVDLVVHFDPPAEAKGYLHRSGRTARAGAAGTVVTLVLPEQAAQVATLRRQAGVAQPMRPVAPEAREHSAAAKGRRSRRRRSTSG
jgi:superfamily II DNA/RNA helicase